MQVIEEPEAIVEAIFDFYESRGFQPTREERREDAEPVAASRRSQRRSSGSAGRCSCYSRHGEMRLLNRRA